MIADRAECTVWQLQDAPSEWIDRVHLALIAENGAARERQKSAERAARRSRGGR
jgi:hypothetical protein